MRKNGFRFLCIAMALCLITPVFLIQTGIPVQAEPVAAADPQMGVTLHCWNWSFQEIEDNLEIIASLGYTSIQTSPIQQAKQPTLDYPSNDWWVFYQPAEFRIDDSGSSALGTKADFQRMCKRAHEYGIKVIVDVVANHMGNTKNGTNGLASSIVQDLQGDSSCWHDIKKNVSNYTSRYDVTQYCMAGLPDLNTSNKKVQGYVLDFLKECIDAGADGFRFDAAKHIETPEDGDFASDFWPTVINGATEYAQSTRGIELYCYGELLDELGGNLPYSAYTRYMSVTDNIWSAGALDAVSNGAAGAFYPGYRKSDDASQLVVWAESHDTYADGTTADVSVENINKTWALMAARSDVMGLYLARPANMSQLLGAASNTGWSYPEVAAANKFHNRFIGASEYVASSGDIVYVERGDSGVVLVNCNGTEAEVSVTAHTMADGTYTDQITGNTFTVSNGTISGSIGSTGIAVVMEGESCLHYDHDAEGFCLSCLANVGHSYDENNICACGDRLIPMRTIYFVNSAKWANVNVYSWYDGVNIITGAWPGNPMTLVEDNIYSYEVPENATNIIFNNTDGIQTDDLIIPADSNMYDYVTGKWSVYGETPEVPDEPEDDDLVNSETDDSQEQPTTSEKKDTQKESDQDDEGSGLVIWVVVAVAVIAIAGIAVLVIKKKQ